MEKLADVVTYCGINPSFVTTHVFKGWDKLEEAVLLMKDKPQDLIKPVVLLYKY